MKQVTNETKLGKKEVCVGIDNDGVLRIIEKLEEYPNQPYLIGSKDYAEIVLPILKQQYNIKVYELLNIYYICASDEADMYMKNLLLRLHDEAWDVINSKRQLIKDICTQLYGCETRVEYALEKLSDYSFLGSHLAGEVSLAFEGLKVTPEEKYEYYVSHFGNAPIDFFMEEGIITDEINKAKYHEKL